MLSVVTVLSAASCMAALTALSRNEAPAVALLGRAKQPRSAIGAQVPERVELRVAPAEAGLSTSQAFRRSAAVLSGPLGEERTEAVRSVELGSPSRDAMRSLIERTDVPSLR